MEIELKNKEEIYSVYYRYRKITSEQKKFIDDLIKSLIHFFDSTIDIKVNYDDSDLINKKLFEFPPTLDKEFLYLSCIFTLIKKYNNKKVIILVKGNDKINTMINFCSQINKYYYKKNKKENINYAPVKIIPFYSRKQLCYNYEALKKSNSYDMDSYCIKLNASKTDKRMNCPYYTNVINEKELLINNDLNKNQKKSKDIIPFECREMDEQLNILFNCEICPFYYYLNNISKDSYDIIICERDYFFDTKKNISIQKVIGFEEKNNFNKFLLVLDEYNDLEDYLIKIFSCVIDKQILNFSEYQLFSLSKLIQNNDNIELPNDKKIIKAPETEIIRYNLFYDMKEYEFSGALRANESIIDWIKRLLYFFPDKMKPINNKKFISPFEFQKEFFDIYYLDINFLEQLYKRLIILLNNINYFDYHKIYHLIHFIYFICTIVKYNENYFVISDKKNRDRNKSAFEYLLLKPNEILTNLKKNHHVLSLTGGIGEEKIVKLYYNFDKMFSYEDDNNLSMYYKTNLYLVNNAKTTSTDTSFYGEILKMLAKNIPDGIICYFPNNKLFHDYTENWAKSKAHVFSYILNDKLIFIEENDSQRLSEIIVNYKKAINNGRGAFLFLTLNSFNKAKFFDDLTGKYSRCILFIGFNPYEIFSQYKNDKLYDLKRNYNKISQYNDQIEIFESIKFVTSKITNKIKDINDKTILIFLEEVNKTKKFILSDNYKNFLPKWLKKMVHIEEDDERNNINEKIKQIPEFLSLNFEN